MARLEPEAPDAQRSRSTSRRSRRTRSSPARRSPATSSIDLGLTARCRRRRARRPGQPRDADRQPARQRAALHAGGRPHRRGDRTGDGRRAILSVVDTGPGIPAAERERVFERFYRGCARQSSLRNRQRPGTVDRAPHRRCARRRGGARRRSRRTGPRRARAVSFRRRNAYTYAVCPKPPGSRIHERSSNLSHARPRHPRMLRRRPARSRASFPRSTRARRTPRSSACRRSSGPRS